MVALVRVFDRLKDAMVVYGGSERQRRKRNYCEIRSRWNERHCRRRVYENVPRSIEDLP